MRDKLLDTPNRSAEHKGLRAFRSIEINIPRAESEAVGLTHDWADHNLRAKSQVRNHTAQHRHLCSILLSEKRTIRLCGDQKLGNHGSHSAKVPWAGFPIELIAPSFYFNKGRRPIGIEFLDGWSKNDMRSFSLRQRTVRFKSARITREVLIGPELRGVDRKADGHFPARRSRGPNQRRMAGVQRAHGWNETDRLSRPAIGARPLPQFFYSAKNLHPCRAQLSQSCNASRLTIASSSLASLPTVFRAA